MDFARFWIKQTALRLRSNPSLSTLTPNSLILIGGANTRTINSERPEFLASVDKYDIKLDKWTPLPDLNEARKSHSSCNMAA